MILDRTLKEFPFHGTIYTTEVNTDLPLTEQTEQEVVVLETECDIQESAKSDNWGSINASFNVYFPFNKDCGINIERGMMFRGSMYGMTVNGKIIGVSLSQLGKCAIYLKDLDV